MEHRLTAVLPHEALEPLFAHVVGCDLGRQIAPELHRSPQVGGDESHQVLVDAPPLDQLQGGDLQALLKVLPDTEGHAAGGEAADIHVVGHVGHVSHQMRAVEDGRDQSDIIEVAGAFGVGSVDDDVVPRLQGLGGHGGNGGLNRRQHHPQMERRAHLALGHQLAVPGEDGAAAVPAVLDIGGEGGPDQSRHHFIGHRINGIGHDLQSDGVGLDLGTRVCAAHWRFSQVIIKLPNSSVSACWPGRMRVVESSCSTMAGPRTTEPHPSPERR